MLEYRQKSQQPTWGSFRGFYLYCRQEQNMRKPIIILLCRLIKYITNATTGREKNRNIFCLLRESCKSTLPKRFQGRYIFIQLQKNQEIRRAIPKNECVAHFLRRAVCAYGIQKHHHHPFLRICVCQPGPNQCRATSTLTMYHYTEWDNQD